MTQLLVVGLLRQGPMGGYDIQMTLQTSDAESWGSVLVGSIYHALKTLERDGLIEVSDVEQTGRRKKSIYRITETGRQRFEELLIEALRGGAAAFPTDFYSGLNFLDCLSTEQAEEALLHRKAELERELARLDAGKIEKKEYLGGQLPAVSELVFEHMAETIRLQTTLIDRILRTLQT